MVDPVSGMLARAEVAVKTTAASAAPVAVPAADVNEYS